MVLQCYPKHPRTPKASYKQSNKTLRLSKTAMAST